MNETPTKETPTDRFLRIQYGETKDICKQFLTLVVAVLVFSVTFSEKVVGFPNASIPAKLCLAFAWTSMLISIVSCGIGLKHLAEAAGDAYIEGTHYRIIAARAYPRIIFAGGSFVAGLILLIIAA